jgi:polar amino acid transport system substrate-binding protein
MKFALTLCTTLLLLTQVSIAQPVKICDDDSEWPPYSYFPRVEGKADRSHLTGAMIDLIGKIFELIQMDYSITAIPWKRCLYEVATFAQNQTYEMAIEGTLNEERLNRYYVTTYVYTTTGGYWYSKTKFPRGPSVKGPEDLKNYSLCGIFGYNYAGYGVPPELISSWPKTYQAAFNMLSLGRCDLFLSNIPTVLGKVTMGKLILPEGVVGKKVPGLESGTFHIFIAKTSPRALMLLTNVNQALHVLTFRGVTDAIFNKYLPTCGRHC